MYSMSGRIGLIMATKYSRTKLCTTSFFNSNEFDTKISYLGPNSLNYSALLHFKFLWWAFKTENGFISSFFP